MTLETNAPVTPGDRIELIEMPDDPSPVLPGSRGIVREVSFFGGRWQIDVMWDEGVNRSLKLVCPPDRYRRLEEGK